MTWDVDRIDSINLCNGSCCKWYHLFSLLQNATKCRCNSLVPIQQSLLQNVGAIHYFLFNGHSLFNGPYSKCECSSLVPVQWAFLVQKSLLKMWVQFTNPSWMVNITKCGCNSLIPLEWSTLQNVSAIH